MKIGVLALQGAFREHEKSLKSCGAETCQIRLPEHLEDIDALVIPGGESTTMIRLLLEYGLLDKIKERAEKGMPIFGTCAGMVLLSKKVEGSDQITLKLMDTVVKRNAFGRQVNSFEAGLDIEMFDTPYRGVFIRAPYIVSVGQGVEVLAKYQDKIVMVKQGNFLASAFHPELTEDNRIHKYFLSMI